MTYVVASTPRSGSNLLQRALWKTGVAGAPEEYLAPAYVRDFDERWGLVRRLPESTAQILKFDGLTFDVDDFVRRLMQVRTSPNGIFGLKLHNDHLKMLLASRIDVDHLLKDPKYLFITQRDKLRQAVSLLRANQTGIWIVDGLWLSTTPGRPEAAHYDFSAIRELLSDLCRQERGWRDFFAQHNLKPLEVEYEHLVDDYDQSVRTCLSFLSVSFEKPIPDPGIQRQADATSEEWIQRFRQDADKVGYEYRSSKPD